MTRTRHTWASNHFCLSRVNADTLICTLHYKGNTNIWREKKIWRTIIDTRSLLGCCSHCWSWGREPCVQRNKRGIKSWDNWLQGERDHQRPDQGPDCGPEHRQHAGGGEWRIISIIICDQYCVQDNQWPWLGYFLWNVFSQVPIKRLLLLNILICLLALSFMDKKLTFTEFGVWKKVLLRLWALWLMTF